MKKPRANRSSPKPEHRPAIFISYRHAAPTAGIADALYEALAPAADAWNADVFMDRHAIEPAELFDAEIVAALERTTHFIVLLNNSYWASNYCRKELARVLERFEHDRSVRLLFVKAEELDPAHYTFDKDRATGRIQNDNPLVNRIGDVQFLGPFDEARQLVRLAYENPARLSDQLAQLVKQLERVVK